METKKLIWTIAKIYFLLFSTVGFTMFVCEESMQITTFGCFAYSQANDFKGLEDHLESTVIPTHKFAKFFINNFGWINPIMWPAYKQYVIGNEGYIASQKAIIAANTPKEVGAEQTPSGKCDNLKKLIKRQCSQNDIVQFGKYKGSRVAEVPHSYIEWWSDQMSMKD